VSRQRIITVLVVALLCTGTHASEPPVSDPTRAPMNLPVRTDTGLVKPAGELRLVSTRVSAGTWVAMINERTVRVGTQIDGAEVIEIAAGRVALRRGSDTFTLRLQRPLIKSPAGTGE